MQARLEQKNVLFSLRAEMAFVCSFIWDWEASEAGCAKN